MVNVNFFMWLIFLYHSYIYLVALSPLSDTKTTSDSRKVSTQNLCRFIRNLSKFECMIQHSIFNLTNSKYAKSLSYSLISHKQHSFVHFHKLPKTVFVLRISFNWMQILAFFRNLNHVMVKVAKQQMKVAKKMNKMQTDNKQME